MPDFKRRDFLVVALAAAAGASEMPSWSPFGPKPLDPRQSKVLPIDPRQKLSTEAKQVKTMMFRQSPASPLHLSGSVIIRPGASGSIPTAALKNPMGQDMELLEIKFELQSTNLLIGAAGVNRPVFGGTIWCDLSMGAIKLTNGSIPVWCFGRAENLDMEYADSNLTQVGAVVSTFSSYSWRLPRPLFVPAGAVVVPSFNHLGFVSDTINVRVGYSARTVFTKPKKFFVPWVAKYASKAFNPISAAGSDLSSELDLVNPFPEPLKLQRFVGRAQVLRVNKTSSESTGNASGDTFSTYFGSQYLSLRMTDSYGRPIIRNYTKFRTVFGALTRSWDMDNGAELDPESYYTVNLKKDAVVLNASGDTGAVGQAFVSMVGWRELESL